jgi:hypothetical protein
MFDVLATADRSLDRFHHEVDVDALSAGEAKAVVEQLARIERRAACGRLRLLRRLEADTAAVDWLAKETGQSRRDAERDLEAAGQVRVATDEALRDGALSAHQAREVASAAAVDPGAEEELLDSAREESLSELRRRAKKVRAAATDDAEKERTAHAQRDLASGTDEETGTGTLRVSGPTAAVATMLAFLEPFIQAEFDKARREGRHERRGAYAFDALLAALGLAVDRRKGSGSADAGPPRSPAKVLVRVDASALCRGRAVAGETCEIDGLGPVPVAALRELLPHAAISLIVTNGHDVFNVTNVSRRANAHQQIVLDWIGGQCSRRGCGATRHLQVDHRIDWAATHVTQLKALDWLCPRCHALKTHRGWALVAGRGRRRMVPPDHPEHPAHSPPAADAA